MHGPPSGSVANAALTWPEQLLFFLSFKKRIPVFTLFLKLILHKIFRTFLSENTNQVYQCHAVNPLSVSHCPWRHNPKILKMAYSARHGLVLSTSSMSLPSTAPCTLLAFAIMHENARASAQKAVLD